MTPGQPPTSGQNSFVLIVEDNPFDVELKKILFRKHRFPYDCFFVRDGAEALDFLQCRGLYSERPRRNPALMLLDFRLPKLDGAEVLTQIRALPHLKPIPVVMIVSTKEDHIALAQRPGLSVFGFLLKPVEYDKLEALMRSLDLLDNRLEEEQKLSPAEVQADGFSARLRPPDQQ